MNRLTGEVNRIVCITPVVFRKVRWECRVDGADVYPKVRDDRNPTESIRASVERDIRSKLQDDIVPVFQW